MTNSGVVLGMDMGGTNLRLGVVDPDGRVLMLLEQGLGTDKSVGAVVKEIIGGIEKLRSWCRSHSLRMEAACLAAPGIISMEEGVIVFSPNLPEWKNVPLKKMISDAVNLPTILENDANAVAFGEYWKGGGKGSRHMVMFTLGTGVGGGIISDGMLIRGSRGMAGELGHMTVIIQNGRQCRCGNFGCLEAYSSATAIVERIAEGWTGRDNPPFTARDAYDLARQGDQLCLEIFREAGFYLGVAFADIVNVINPEVIVVGGGVTQAWDFIMPAAHDQLKSRAFRHTDLAEKVAIRKAELGNAAGIVGSAGIFWYGATK